ncbi:MAG TPA: TIGR03943 family protein [Actinomycetota bacterium]|nr:TIGR03943 family protein [Actinomycetota bacterium]
MTRWSALRVATGGVLAAWAGLFWFLLATDRTALFLSSRTEWLVPSGAVLLTLAAIGRLASARTVPGGDGADALTRRDAWTLGAIALPVVILVAMPPVTLGTYAVGKRASFVGSSVGSSVRVVSGSLDFVDVAAAQSFDDAARVLAKRAGEPIALDGIVSATEGLPPDEFLLTRFIVTCCTADATIAQVRVVGAPPGAFEPDQWVEVRGRIYPVGREVLVAAERVEAIPAPPDPYLTP